MNIDALRSSLRERAGVERIADLGIVHRGRMGYADCEVEVGIEVHQGNYFISLAVTHRKSAAGSRNLRVVTWPYSRSSARDLAGVIADFRRLEEMAQRPPTTGNRGWLARLFDRLLGRTHLGEHLFASPLEETGPEKNPMRRVVRAVVCTGRQAEVSLFESRRRGGATTLAQFPLAACPPLRAALGRYSTEGG